MAALYDVTGIHVQSTGERGWKIWPNATASGPRRSHWSVITDEGVVNCYIDPQNRKGKLGLSVATDTDAKLRRTFAPASVVLRTAKTEEEESLKK